MGCFVKPDPSIAEFAALAGWNFIVFDAEHGTIEPGDCENLVRAVELGVQVKKDERMICDRLAVTRAIGVTPGSSTACMCHGSTPLPRRRYGR